MASTREELIFQELEELVPIGEKALEQQQQQLYNPTIQHPKLSVPADDSTFEILTKAFTTDDGSISDSISSSGSGNGSGSDEFVKRSYRIMNYITQDLDEAKEFLKPNFGSDNDDLYLKYVLNPTRAGLLAKQIFAAYRSLLTYHQSTNTNANANANANANTSTSTSTSTSNTSKKSKTNNAKNTTITKPQMHVPHLNKLLQEMLQAFPTQVIGASCAGGEKGVEKALSPMLHLHPYLPLSHSPLPTIQTIIALGTTGRKHEELSLQQQQQMAMMGQMVDVNKVHVSNGHRRKFVHGLCQWGGWLRFMDLLTLNVGKDTTSAVNGKDNDNCETGVGVEEVMEVVLESVEFIAFPSKENALSMANVNANANKKKKEEESVGEEALLGKLASGEMIRLLFDLLDLHSGRDGQNSSIGVSTNGNGNGKGNNATKGGGQPQSQSQTQTQQNANQNNADAVAGALLGLFELATGKSRRQNETPDSTTMAQTDDDGVECKAAEGHDRDQSSFKPKSGIDDNKMVKAGITDKMHSAICKEMTSLVAIMDVYMSHQRKLEQQQQHKEQANLSMSMAVRHPGRYIVENPFTCNRLQLLTLFTDLVSYESHCHYAGAAAGTNASSKIQMNREETYKCAKQALDVIMELPLPPAASAEDGNASNAGSVSASVSASDSVEIYNPWSGICDLLFLFPENNMLQVQFYRLIHALCMTNHEPTLKLLVQKCKFLSRAIKSCSAKVAPCSTRGVLLRCLNALRLHSQSISPHSFLRHYLESHDGWKGFQEELTRMTLEQQQRGGGIPVPAAQGEEGVVMAQSDIDIDLGSAFAMELGFASDVEMYVESADDSFSDASSHVNASANGSPNKKKKKKVKKKKSKK